MISLFVMPLGQCESPFRRKMWTNKENSSYILENFRVREYNTKYLGMTLQGSQVILINDIGEVKQLD